MGQIEPSNRNLTGRTVAVTRGLPVQCMILHTTNPDPSPLSVIQGVMHKVDRIQHKARGRLRATYQAPFSQGLIWMGGKIRTKAPILGVRMYQDVIKSLASLDGFGWRPAIHCGSQGRRNQPPGTPCCNPLRIAVEQLAMAADNMTTVDHSCAHARAEWGKCERNTHFHTAPPKLHSAAGFLPNLI